MAQPQVLSPCCVEGYLWRGTPHGTESTLGGLPTYVAHPPSGASTATAVLFIHDIFGWKAVNPRLLCDRMAAISGHSVYMPDFYAGECVGTPGNLKEDAMVFLGRHGIEAAGSRIEAALTALRAAGVQRIGAVGYCWGGRYSLRLGRHELVRAVVAAHPSLVDPAADVTPTHAATLLVMAGTDTMFEGERKASAIAAIKAAGVDLEVADYPSTKHGFSVRGPEDEANLAARDDACTKTAKWFAKHI
ncbi:dienelactone hydrolase [Entophlyctis helioformis]|nr:dienelactone hydrolase [Entophlyctis helioformis]